MLCRKLRYSTKGEHWKHGLHAQTIVIIHYECRLAIYTRSH